MTARRRAREIALQILYLVEAQGGLAPDRAVDSFFQWLGSDEEERLDSGGEDFVRVLVRGVAEHLESLDQQITEISRNWRVDRMSRVDRNVLRLALYELRFSHDVPKKVAINEAIEIAKRFGTAESGAFVNGILDKCLHLSDGDDGSAAGDVVTETVAESKTASETETDAG